MKKYIKYNVISGTVFLTVFILSGCSSQTQRATDQQQQTEENEPAVESQEQTKEPVVEIKEENETEIINFETVYQNDLGLEKGQSKVKQEGKNGTKELKYKVAYTDGKESVRELISESTTVQPTNKIILIGTKPIGWICNCSKTCPQMISCAEAQYQLNKCGCSARDADNDGIACDVDCQ